MSILVKTLKPAQVFSFYRALGIIQAKRSAHWYPDYKPNKVPTTKAEREAAAKKYGLLPEEYEPYEEGEGYGDYPKLPEVSVDAKDPWYPWDNEELRKNFNEPVHVRIVNYLPFALSSNNKEDHTKGFFRYLSIIGICLTVLYAFHQLKVAQPLTSKQYPNPGVTHHSFDIDYEEAHRRANRKYICREVQKGENDEGAISIKDLCK